MGRTQARDLTQTFSLGYYESNLLTINMDIAPPYSDPNCVVNDIACAILCRQPLGLSSNLPSTMLGRRA